MQEIIYSIRVPATGPARADLADLLDLAPEQLPERVRLSTISPLSNRGYPPDAEAEVLAVRDEGLIIGVPNSKVPRSLVPWQNMAYLSEE